MKWQDRPDRSGWWWVSFSWSQNKDPQPCEVWIGSVLGRHAVLARMFGVGWKDITRDEDARWLPMAVPEAPSELTLAPDGE